MYQNHAKAIRYLGIAIVILAALSIVVCLLGLALTVFSGSMATAFVPYSHHDHSIASGLHDAGFTDDESVALFTILFSMLGLFLVWALICSVLVLVAGIKAMGAGADPTKLKSATTWNIVGAVASFLGCGIITTVLCIIAAVFASKDRAALEAGFLPTQPPTAPYGSPYPPQS